MSNPTKHQLLLVGYAADAPEISATPSGTLVARLAIYTRHVYKRNGQEIVETDRHSIRGLRREGPRGAAYPQGLAGRDPWLAEAGVVAGSRVGTDALRHAHHRQ